MGATSVTGVGKGSATSIPVFNNRVTDEDLEIMRIQIQNSKDQIEILRTHVAVMTGLAVINTLIVSALCLWR